MGDSIVKKLSSWKLTKSTSTKVTVSAVPGARVQDMYHYVKPSLEKSDKPVNVLLHVGTNDLKYNSPQNVADQIINLAKHIEDNRPQTNVQISELTKRCDSDELSSKVREVNKLINKYCKQSGRSLTKHNNIDELCLNQGKLHLNNKGVAILASNFTNTILTSN